MVGTMKVVNRLVLSVLVLVLAGLTFLYVAPGYNLYLVRSSSMTPAINVGDLIVTGPMGGAVNGAVVPGTIVTYERRKELITHRVWSRDGEVLVTKGDAVEDPDPWTVSLADVRGVYLFKIPSVGYLTNFVRSRRGWFLTIIVPATVLVGWLVKDILQEAFRED